MIGFLRRFKRIIDIPGRMLAILCAWTAAAAVGSVGFVASLPVQAAVRVMDDGTIFDSTWYAAQYKDAAAAGGTSAAALYRYYQLYGQGLGEKAYDESAVGQTTLDRLEKSSEKVKQSKRAAYGAYSAAWDTVTTRIYDTDTVKVWHSEYLVSDAAKSRLDAAIAEFEGNGYSLGFVVVDLRTGDAVSYKAGEVVYSASVIKAPYIFSLLESGTEPTRDMYLAGNQSDNDAYRRIRNQYGNDVFTKWLSGTNVPAEQSKSRYINTTPLDLARMFYKGTNLLLGNETYSDWARNTFTGSLNSAVAMTVGGEAEYSSSASDTESTEEMTGTVNGTSGTTKPVYSKAGWIASGTDNSYTNAAVVGGDYPYVVAMMSNSPGYKGIEYAQDLMPALDQYHDEMVDPSKASGANVAAVEQFASSAVSAVGGK